MQLFIVRHGQTKANHSRLFQGTTDHPLNETGHGQARDVARELSTESIAALYASPMRRAMQTAAPLADRLALNVQPVPEFREVNCGSWEGTAFDDILQNEGELLNKWLTDPDSPAPDGESLGQVYERVHNPLDEILSRHRESGDTIVIVAHGAVNRALICHLLEIGPERAFRFDQMNGCINRFDIRHPYPPKLVLANSTAHLGG